MATTPASNPATDAMQQVLDNMTQMTKAWQELIAAQIKDQLANVTAVAAIAKTLGTPSAEFQATIEKVVEFQKQQMSTLSEGVKALTSMPKL
jgi:hypothetical protein